MKAKCNYESPNTEIIRVKIDGICEWITQSPPSDDFAKENDIIFEDWDTEEDDLDTEKSLWED